MVSVLASSAVDHGIGPGQIKKTNGIYCFSAKHTELRSKSKTGWLRIRTVCQWSDMSHHGL
jgi:hypothetical protein